jgi:hypothetical protein
MKKLLLLAVLPLSVAMFSFTKPANNTGVNLLPPGEYDVLQPNTINPQDQQSIVQSVCNLYGIQNDGNPILVQMQATKTKRSFIGKVMVLGQLSEFCTWEETQSIEVPDQKNIDQILSTYVNQPQP